MSGWTGSGTDASLLVDALAWGFHAGQPKAPRNMTHHRLLAAAALLSLGLFTDSSVGQTALQPCSGETSTWNECTGTLEQKDGTTYVGEFRNGLFDGKGTLSWKDGDRYTGEFKSGLREGTGTVTLSKVAKISGRWSGGRYLGP